MMPFSPNENHGHIMNYYIWFHKQASTCTHSAQCLCSLFSGKDWEKLLNVIVNNNTKYLPLANFHDMSYDCIRSMSPQFLLSICCTTLMKKSNFTPEWNYSETEKGSITEFESRQPASYSSGRQKIRLRLKLQKISQQI